MDTITDSTGYNCSAELDAAASNNGN